MDVLSDVISTIRTGQPRSTRIAWHSPWGMRFPETTGPGFQVVLQGSCWLLMDGEEPLRLGVGDVVFLPHGQEFALADSTEHPLPDPSCHSFVSALRESGSLPPLDRPGPPVTELVCDADGPRPLLRRFGSASVGTADADGPSCVTVGGAYHACPARPHPMLTELPRVVHLPARVGMRPELTAAVDLLGGELGGPRQGSDAVIPSLLDILLLYILRAFLEEHRPGGACGWVGALRDPAVSAAVKAVHEDPAHPWTVAGLGERAGLSRAAFSRRFTSLVGQSPLAYVTWWRLTRAGLLLRESDAPISAVAARVGYSSQFAFANAFKREFGMAPGGYRRGTDALLTADAAPETASGPRRAVPDPA
ncbi:AraC family transcriptional regulator [Nocardiopsis sp. CT-R113]|uniref:AraC family transcriptional regulator n=1 Tax=Nocardiopsis codii TaxID=3065942 RepID=A0ABU7KFL7_9ACTN|nr:AraC family transcriptional regulator [Nocardiopsis sp. CT-R113]MEE2040792.1 AraC family transcriptional regulator [Nocardiopsis sp. CT-R113]